MGPAERQNAIINILCVQRYETMANLASELGVSLRTICRDITTLSCSYPIVTVRGRNVGGVKVEDWFFPERKTLAKPQETLLLRLREPLSGEDLIIMNSILVQFSASRGC